MAGWLIGVPCWGDHYINLAKNVMFPSIAAALKKSSLPARVVIHTNTPEALDFVEDDLGLSVQFKVIGGGHGWNMYPSCHQEIFAMAEPGEYVAALPADVAVSIEFFACCERLFAQGKKAVVSEGSRTLSPILPPIGVSGRELMDWAIDRLHPFNREGFWGEGRIDCPSVIYFRDGDCLVKHCFHMGPMGFIKDDREYRLDSSNDGSFMESFTPDEIHIAQVEDLVVIECSPSNKMYSLQEDPFQQKDVVEWAKMYTTPMHRHMFRHPVILKGEYKGSSKSVVDGILSALG